MNKLFEDSDSDDDHNISLETQNEYAKKYNTWREKEELYKLEQKYGDKMGSGEDDSDSEDDSDEPPEISEEMETQFLKTLALLKKKDPRIYDSKYSFFSKVQEENVKEDIKEETTSKPKKDVNSLAAAFADSDEDSDGGEIFKVEKRTPQPPVKEDTVKAYLTGKVEHIKDEEELAPLKALWSDPKLNEGEAFLRDYILNRKYLEEDEQPLEKQLDAEELEQDEARVEEQGQFERAYNFRFEEPDQEYLKRYPRTMSAVRPKDDRRARKRAEVRARRDEEKRKKMAEIDRMKALKRKEICAMLDKIKQVTANDRLAFTEEDMEGDFDVEEHDRRMREIFDEEYYHGVDNEKPVFPDLDQELEIENWENYEEEQMEDTRNEDDGPHCEDEDFNMDAEYDPNKARTTLMEEIKETLGKKRRNRKRKSKLAEVLATDKPKYVPGQNNKSYTEHMEEYYKMDCEDVIGGDLPTRFKYREVVPNSFGLTVEEILLADDKELNQWASLKKAVKYRPDHVEKGEVNTYRLKAQDAHLKKKFLPSLFKHTPEEPELVAEDEPKKKKKKKQVSQEKEDSSITEQPLVAASSSDIPLPKKKHKNKKEVVSTSTSIVSEVNQTSKTPEKPANKKPKNKKHKNRKINKNNNNKPQLNKNENENTLGKLSNERLKAFGLNPKKYRSFLKYKKF